MITLNDTYIYHYKVQCIPLICIAHVSGKIMELRRYIQMSK